MSAQYFAKLDENNMVTHVAVVTSEFMAENPERYEGVWVETFFDVEGKTYAGVGYLYDADTNNFVEPPAPVEP